MSKILYKPENGIDGAEFMMMHCGQCKHQPGCAIPLRTMLFTVHEDIYPEEWILDEGKMPTCTKFDWEEKQVSGVGGQRSEWA